MMWLFKLALVAIGLYAAVAGLAYFMQSWLIFPAGLAAGVGDLPAHARNFELETGDGERIVVVRIAPSRPPAEPHPVLLGFGGNAWNAEAMANLLHRIFPEHEIIAQHYRGYGPSTGRPSAKALFADARRVYDHLGAKNNVDNDSAKGIIAIGFSLGASVAVDLAAARKLQGLVLVTPFDSLKEMAASNYPWLPVRLLLRHHMEAAATLRGLDVPLALITAANDTVVPRTRSAPFRQAAGDLRADIVIEGAGHNDIYDRSDFVSALRQGVDAVAGK